MILEDFAILAAVTARSQAYIQALVKHNYLPAKCILFTDDKRKLIESTENNIENDEQFRYYNINEPLLITLNKYKIPYEIINNKDINSDDLMKCISSLEQKYIIYSGYGSYILKNNLFELGKQFIHIHAGILPQYRGSTTAYYSLLQENAIGATAIFMSTGIDEGKIIAQDTYSKPPKGVDIDYIYEPFVRSQVLIKVIDKYLEKNDLTGDVQEQGKSETYFIIHPVLKHLAIMEIENTEIV